MNKALMSAIITSLLAGCSVLGEKDRDSWGRLTDEKLEELDGTMRSWSDARKKQDMVAESVLRRQLRREAGRHIDGLKLGVASGDSWKRATSAALLGFAEDESAVGLLVGLLDDDNQDVRAAAMLALVLTDSSRTPVIQVLERMKDPEPVVRRLAVLMLARLYDPGTRPEIYDSLLSALKDADAGVRVNATSALVRLGETRSAQFLAKVGLKDSDGLVRRNAAVGLGRLKVPETAEDLMEALDQEMSPAVKAEITRALEKVTGLRGGTDAASWREAIEAEKSRPAEKKPEGDEEEEPGE